MASVDIEHMLSSAQLAERKGARASDKGRGAAAQGERAQPPEWKQTAQTDPPHPPPHPLLVLIGHAASLTPY